MTSQDISQFLQCLEQLELPNSGSLPDFKCNVLVIGTGEEFPVSDALFFVGGSQDLVSASCRTSLPGPLILIQVPRMFASRSSRLSIGGR